jgi:hypothetical protein
MLTFKHQQEFQASAIAPALAQQNFHSTDDNWLIRQWLNWKAAQRWKPCPFTSGWYCHTLDPLTGEQRNWGPFKPDDPLIDNNKGKARKYEHPAGYETLAILLDVDRRSWEAIARRYRVPITPLMLRLRDRNSSPHFWQWVWTYNLPIIICEGAKKAAALLSAGYVAIALPGVWNGRKKRQGKTPEQLIPDLQHFATLSREIYFCFDHDPNRKTRQQVSHALVRTGKLFEAADCIVKVIRLPGAEKGVDDFIVARGAESFDQIYLDAITLASYDRHRQHGLMGYELTYPIAVDLKQQYLLQPDRLTSFGSALPLPDTGVIALLSDMGTGKTELLKAIKEAHPQARILNLGHRIALLRNLSTRLGTAIYSDHGWNMWQEQWLSLTADSLHKLKTEGNTYDYIFLDECEQFIQHLLCSSTCKEHRHAILQSLKHFIYSAKCIVLSDAHLSDISLQFILAMRPDPDEIPFVIRNRYQNGNRRVFWYEGGDRSGIVRQIKASLFRGDRVIVACDGLEFSKDLYEALQSLFPEKRIVCINSENSNEPGMRSLIENINQPGKLDGIDCFIYSPSVNTGVSIDTPHFDKVFGVFVGGSLAGTDCIQALNRYRPKVDWHVWVGAHPIGGYRPTSADRIQHNKLQENDLCGFLLKIIVGSGEKTVEDAFAWQAWAAIQARRNESLNNLRGDVRYLIEAQGHSLMALGEEIDGETKAELKAARSLNQQARSQGICNAEPISATVARRLESKERPTLEDYYKLERYRIETSWGKAIDPELIERDQGGRTIRQFTLLEALLEAPSEVSIFNGKRIHFPPAILAAKDQAEREKFHALDWRNDSVAWSLRRELGLHSFLQLEREFRNDDLDLLELQRQAQRHALIIKDFLGITVRRNATPIQILQQLLEQIGLQLLCDRREGSRGDQVRVYRFDPEVWAIAQEVLEYRQSKRQAKSQQGFEPSVESVVTGVPFAEYINKGGGVTTENESLSEELADGLDILIQAVECQEGGLVRSLWMAWDLPQRSAVLMHLSDEVRSRVMETLGLVSGAIVRWVGKVGDWMVEAVEGLQVKVRQDAGLGQDWRVAFTELDPIDLS